MRSLHAAVVAALTACSGATVNAVRAPAPAVREAPAAPTEVLTRSCESGLETVDSTHFLLCGQRIEVRDERAVFADDETADRLQWAVEASDGWVFLTDNNLVLRSDDFTGALRPLGRLDGGFAVMFHTRGRAGIIARGELWLSDGRTLSRADVLGRPVIGVAFFDAARGAAVVSDGSLARTTDGGARWTSVDLGGDRALSLWFDRTMTVRLALRSVTLMPDGTLGLASPTASAEPESTATATVSAALAERRVGFDRVYLTDDVWASPIERGMNFHDGRNPDRTIGLSNTPWFGRGRSDLLRWGRSLALAIPVDNDLAWHRLDADGRITRVFGPDGAPSIAFPEEGVAWSDDGRHVGWIGRCPSTQRQQRDGELVGDESASESDERGDAAPSTMCVLEDGVRRWREVPLPDAAAAGVRWSLRGFHRASALLQNTFEPTEHAVVDTASGAKTTVRCDDPSVHIRWLRWAFDGALAGAGERCADGCEPVVLHGAADGPLSARPSPGGDVAVDFVDADRGLALDVGFATLWRTRDGARTWETVMTRVPRQRADQPRVMCDADGCAVGERVRVRGWGALPTLTREVVSGSDAPVMALGEPAPPRERDLRATPMRCEFVGASRPSPWRAENPMMRAAWRDGVAGLSAVGTGESASARVAWWTEGRHGVTTLPMPEESLRGDRVPFVVLGAGRAAMIMTERPAPRVLWLDGQSARPLDQTPFDASEDWSMDPSALLMAPADDGGVAVAAHLPTNPSTMLIADLSARGAVRAWRVFVRDEGVAALARHEGRWGLLSADDARGARFEALTGDAVTTVAPWTGTMGVCAEPAAADATTLYATISDHVPQTYLEHLGDARSWRVVAELSRRGACVRELSALFEPSYESARVGRERLQGDFSLHLRSAASGSMAGFADDGRRRLAVRCQPRTEER